MSKTQTKRDHLLSNEAYDAGKFVAQIALPAVGTLYFTIAQIWGLPRPTDVVGTITAVDTCLGILLGLSTSSYNNSEAKYDGQVIETAQNGSKVFSLELNDNVPLDNLSSVKSLTFKVKPATPK